MTKRIEEGLLSVNRSWNKVAVLSTNYRRSSVVNRTLYPYSLFTSTAIRLYLNGVSKENSGLI